MPQDRDDPGWRAIFERSGCAMLLLDDDRRIVTANAAASRMLGRPRKELERESLDDITVWPEAAVRASQWRALHDAGVMVVERRFARADGGEVDLEVCATATVLPSRHLLVGLPAGVRHQPVAEAHGQPLTAREMQVAQLLAEGLTGEEIATRLVVSPETVRTHIRNAMGKLGARTRAHLVALLMRERFVR